MKRLYQIVNSLFQGGPHITQKVRAPFDLETPLCYFGSNPSDVFTIREAAEGIQIFGASGSGKSTGSGRHLALALLQSGAGGLVLTVKPDEPAHWKEYCSAAGRLNDLVVFSPSQPWRFNPLEYQYRRAGSGHITENIVNLFSSLSELLERGAGASTPDYWSRAQNQLVRNATDLAAISRGTPTLDLIYNIIVTAPQSAEEARADTWQRTSLCYRCIVEGERRPKNAIQQMDWPQVVRFWLHEFPTLSSRTRSCIVSTFSTVAEVFLRGELRRLFSTTTNITPEITFQGKILLLDLPIKQFGELGRLAQVLWKHLWQKAAEARDIRTNPRHVFLWADESQHFISRADPLFLTTSRSAKVVTVLLTQNIPNYLTVLARSEVDSLLANLATKIWHRNSCTITNQMAADTIARSRQFHWNTGLSMSEESAGAPRVSHNVGGSDALEWDILPGDFQFLRSGGPNHNFEVEAILYQAGRLWAGSGKNHLRVSYNQQDYV
jgi:hypothetical protein